MRLEREREREMRHDDEDDVCHDYCCCCNITRPKQDKNICGRSFDRSFACSFLYFVHSFVLLLSRFFHLFAARTMLTGSQATATGSEDTEGKALSADNLLGMLT